MSNTNFYSYLYTHLDDLRLLEVSDLFPRDQINELFYREIDRLLREVGDHRSREELQEFRRMDHVAYIDSSLKRAGFRDPDLDPLVHDLVVKLIVTGNLFSGWHGQSLIGRFKVAVSNAIKTLATKRSSYKKRSLALPDDLRSPPQQDSDDLIHEFRLWLRARYGEVAVKVFDHRLEGGDTSELVGEKGLESSYKVKEAVKTIKNAAAEYFQRNPALFRNIQKVFDREQRTLNQRFSRVSAR
jgi:hypothetical protein